MNAPVTRPLEWVNHENARPDIQADIVSAGNYVISCRPGHFYLSYRPEGDHHPLGSFAYLQGAKNAAEHHHTMMVEGTQKIDEPKEVKRARRCLDDISHLHD